MNVGTVPVNVIRAMTRSLKESYPELTEEYVTSRVELLKGGQEPNEIIGMFVKDMLEDANIITYDEDE